MPKKYDRCVKKVKKNIKSGTTPKTYMVNGKRKKSSAYAICKSAIKKKGGKK